MIKRALLLSLLLAVGSLQAQDQTPPTDNAPATDSPQAQAQAPAQAQTPVPITSKLGACVVCHGVDGNNWVKNDDGAFGKTNQALAIDVPTPKLAEQGSDYLFKQFDDFKNSARISINMNGMIRLLSDDDWRAAAEFYAEQKLISAEPTAAKDSETFKLGQKIWRAGIASKGVPACAACHGPAGKGIPAQYPALAGQFPDYAEFQLKAFRDGTRANDPAEMMRDIALKMTDPEIKAISDYAAGLR